jgi:hypothetical protein
LPWARGEIFALALAGFVISLLVFWPGFMEFDFFDQYAQAIGKEQLNDWHPVILVFVWKLSIFCARRPAANAAAAIAALLVGVPVPRAAPFAERQTLARRRRYPGRSSLKFCLASYFCLARPREPREHRKGRGLGLPFCRSKFGHSVV